jgi:hypothetical protein
MESKGERSETQSRHDPNEPGPRMRGGGSGRTDGNARSCRGRTLGTGWIRLIDCLKPPTTCYEKNRKD